MNQDNSFTLNRENIKNMVIINHFCFFSDLLDVYYDTNEHIDMNPIKSYPTSPGTSLEYPHHIHESIFEN